MLRQTNDHQTGFSDYLNYYLQHVEYSEKRKTKVKVSPGLAISLTTRFTNFIVESDIIRRHRSLPYRFFFNKEKFSTLNIIDQEIIMKWLKTVNEDIPDGDSFDLDNDGPDAQKTAEIIATYAFEEGLTQEATYEGVQERTPSWRVKNLAGGSGLGLLSLGAAGEAVDNVIKFAEADVSGILLNGGVAAIFGYGSVYVFKRMRRLLKKPVTIRTGKLELSEETKKLILYRAADNLDEQF